MQFFITTLVLFSTITGGITAQECQRRVDLALRPAFQPLAARWVRQRLGPDATASIRTIGLEAGGTIHVHVDATAPDKACIFALYYRWENGWQQDQVDNHSPAASGCR